MQCPTCGFDNPAGYRFCGSCGNALEQSCPNCGAPVPAGHRFCGACGFALGDEVQAPIPAAPEMPSERRRVTVLFADLVGFSTLAEHLDPEELRGLMTGTFGELTAAVETREGVVEKFIGDAVMAIFGAPVTHEDDPDRAVAAALEMLEVVRLRSERTPSPLRLRIGVNSGLVVSGGVGDGTQAGVMGDAVNTAARLQQAAGPGEVLVSAAVWRRIRDRYEAEHVGLLEVKGREQTVDAYRIVGTRQPDVRKQAPFVGRREERALLDLLWSSAVKGNTHVVSLVGEPGVGKSRLMGEFDPRGDPLDIRLACGSERAFGPFLDLIEILLGAMPADLDALSRRVRELGGDQDVASLLGAFLGLAGAPPTVRMADEQQKRQVFAGVWQFLLQASNGRPTLVVLDDVHWSDRASLDLLGFLLERLGGAPFMLVLAYRPGFDQVERTALRASHTAIRLEPLSPHESVALARGFLGVHELPPDLERLVASRAEGNPFFVEELLQALLELGALAVVDSTAVLAKVEVEVPDTVQGTILARVDRLEPKERGLLQHAAVIGRSFSTELIRTILGGEDVQSLLDGLSRAQLLVPQGPDQWTFKHALIQEVTYETLLLRQRRDMHRKVAEALEARAGDDPAFLEALAEHYARADVPEKTREYALRAGDLASERMGFVEARARFETALRLWGEGDERGRLELLTKLAWTRLMAGDIAGAKTGLTEAADAWQRLGETHRAGAALARLGRAMWIGGEGERARGVITRALDLLEPAGPTPALVQAYMWASTQSVLLGFTDEGTKLATRGLELAETLDLPGERSQLLNNIGLSSTATGDAAGLDTLRQALELADRSGDAEAIGRAYTNLPSSLSTFCRFREAADLCARGRQVMRRLGAPSFEQFIAANEAGCLMELGRYEDAEALALESLEGQRAIGAIPGVVSSGMTLADLLTRKGRHEEAGRLIEEVIPLARGLGGSQFLSQALGVQAHLGRARGNLATARQAIEEAIDIVLTTTSIGDRIPLLVPEAQLAPQRFEEVAAPIRPRAIDPGFGASLLEADAILSGDPNRFAEAADRYAAFDMPYQEARCRLEAGQLDRASEIVRRFGLESGPVGARLRELSADAD